MPLLLSLTQSTTRSVNENAKVGQHVGNPVTATEDEDLNLLTYSLTITEPSDATPLDPTDDAFKIDAKTGQIMVANALRSADGSTADTPVTTHTVNVTARDPFGASDGDLTPQP